MPVKTIAIRKLKGEKRSFYCDDGCHHREIDFYPAELVEKIITDLSSQVLEERKKWACMFDHFKAKRKELRDARHAAVAEKDKYERALRILVEHDLIKDCPHKAAVKNLVKREEL